VSEGFETARITISIAIDGIADAALRAPVEEPHQESALSCDACDEPIVGEPAGSGLYLWTRGDEIRFEEPPLCASCATAIGVTALAQWSVEEEEG
jgi:hypothetical protein